MGGSAFSSKLLQSAFPRLPPVVYTDLKMRLFPKLQNLYSFVAVPHEAPEKGDYGDLDFVVAGPKRSGPSTKNTTDSINVPHELLEEVIGACYVNPMEGNRTSNFAIAVEQGEWAQIGHEKEETQYREQAEAGRIYYQVDVNVCANQAEWERVVFFHGYGDLGMIMGLCARNAGLALGTKGLKLPNPPNPPIQLSESFNDITEFMGLSMTEWKAGFGSKREVFEWAGASRLFVASQFRSEGEGFKRVKPERRMYAEFIQWAMERTAVQTSAGVSSEKQEERQRGIRDEALRYFGKKEEFDSLARERSQRIQLKQTFTGSKIRDWTDLGEYWKGVKLIMDTVRLRVGGEEGVLRILDGEGEEGLKRVVLEVKDELRIGVNANPPI
ncbi:hypothetical protein BDZ94DRAFT_1257197 [Collybia nuda]|uniref:Uncharacterized protein n=1 Tax=Collybia nuda TaxID=64659 RepID=A0A9P5YAK1_9AGAR|nr:hypothetical protein BDZ94DRAFT_1257197 [Collybia nuda]